MRPNDEPISPALEASVPQPFVQDPPAQESPLPEASASVQEPSAQEPSASPQDPPASAQGQEAAAEGLGPAGQPPSAGDTALLGQDSAQESVAGAEGQVGPEFSFTWEGIKEWATALIADVGLLLLLTFGILVLGWLVYKVVDWGLHRIEKKFVKGTVTQVDDHIFHFVHRAVHRTIIVVAVLEICRLWSLEKPEPWIEAVWMMSLFLPGSRLAGALLRVAEGPLLARNPNLGTALPLINRGVRISVVVLGVLVALAHAGLNITPILGGAGVMGLALSLAAKDTLSNLIAGVLLTIDRPFQVGDRIELWSAPQETGTWGDVIDIGLRATKIRNPDNLVVVVPNNEIMQRDIINYTMSGEDIRLRLPFSVAYESDVHRAKDVLVRVALEVKHVKTKPAPFVIVRGFGPSEVNLQLRVWISDARSRRRVGDEITERALVAFEAEGLEIPYPKRELYIHHAGALQPPPSPKK